MKRCKCGRFKAKKYLTSVPRSMESDAESDPVYIWFCKRCDRKRTITTGESV